MGGILLQGDNISIKGNTINFFNMSTNSPINDNPLTFGIGIYVHPTQFWHRDYNISYNKITNFTYSPGGAGGEYGILASIKTNSNVAFYMNDISNCLVGMEIEIDDWPSSKYYNIGDEPAIIIKQNNFRKNILNTYRTFRGINRKMMWQNNYWGRFRLFPKVIVVFRMITEEIGIPSRLEFDMHPAQEPYDIW